MFRLLWHIIPENKSIWIWLTSIYGVWLKRSKKVLNDLWIDFMKKVKDISEEEQKIISDRIREFILENDLRREVAAAIRRLKEIKCYRWMRHNVWLPVRWQLTRKNARTAKKLLWRSKVRPVLKK